MLRNNYPFFVGCLIVGAIFLFGGAFLMLQHWPYSSEVMLAGQFLAYIFSAACLTEIYSYRNLSTLHKIIWTVFLFTSPLFTGTIYHYARKKYVVDADEEVGEEEEEEAEI